MRVTTAGLGATLAATALSGCLKLNPAYDRGDGSGGGSGEPVTTGEATTGEATTGEVTTGTGEAGTGEATTGEATTGAIEPATDGSSSSGGATTGPGEPTVAIGAEIATCVLTAIDGMGHVGPATCEQLVAEDAGLSSGGMVVDKMYNDPGGGRPGLVFMRFAIPDQLPGPLQSATLVFQVADVAVAGSGAGGAVRLAQPFADADLESQAPGWLPGFEVLVGAVAQGQQVEVALPPAAISAGAPLHVGIWPYSDDSAIYLSSAAEGALRPRLELTAAP